MTLTDERGSSLILTIFYGALALVIILVVAASTSLYLERKRLLALADAAALVGAEAFDLSTATFDGDKPSVTLESSDVHTAVTTFLDDYPAAQLDNLRLEEAGSIDGKSASVTLSSAWMPPVLTLFVPDGIRLDASSVARSVFD
ncbi:hypothetical protein GCM10027416_13050 [Okibacterium endophyticum]